jgi:hypothetical protein
LSQSHQTGKQFKKWDLIDLAEDQTSQPITHGFQTTTQLPPSHLDLLCIQCLLVALELHTLEELNVHSIRQQD